MCLVLTLSTKFHENAPDEFSSFSNTIETVPETAREGQEQVCCILWDDTVDVIGTQRTLSMGKRTLQLHQLGYGWCSRSLLLGSTASDRTVTLYEKYPKKPIFSY
jgi:hypothetical protein